MMKNEYRLNTDNLISRLKSFITLKGTTLAKLKTLVDEKYGKTDKYSNLTRKFRENSLKTSDLFEILDILGYEIIVREK
jgi:hypothetical protein